jgi:hypothetical protein
MTLRMMITKLISMDIRLENDANDIELSPVILKSRKGTSTENSNSFKPAGIIDIQS